MRLKSAASDHSSSIVSDGFDRMDISLLGRFVDESGLVEVELSVFEEFLVFVYLQLVRKFIPLLDEHVRVLLTIVERLVRVVTLVLVLAPLRRWRRLPLARVSYRLSLVYKHDVVIARYRRTTRTLHCITHPYLVQMPLLLLICYLHRIFIIYSWIWLDCLRVFYLLWIFNILYSIRILNWLKGYNFLYRQ